MEERLVTIRTYSVLWEADLARVFLEQEGVRALLADENMVGMNWLYCHAVGGIKLQTPESEAPRARELLAERERKRGENSADTEESTACPSCGSTNVETVWRGRRACFLSWLLIGIPLFWPLLTKRCVDCGHTWKGRKR